MDTKLLNKVASIIMDVHYDLRYAAGAKEEHARAVMHDAAKRLLEAGKMLEEEIARKDKPLKNNDSGMLISDYIFHLFAPAILMVYALLTIFGVVSLPTWLR